MSERPNKQRRLAAIMLTDIVGYSALAHKNDDLALALLKTHNEFLRPFFSEFGGNEIKTMGDSFLIEFQSASSAMNCAVRLQQAILARNADEETESKFQIRIGIHVGDIVFQDGDVFGDGVNIAARIEPLAPPNGICFTQAVYDQVRGKLPHAPIRVGGTHLKNISSSVSLFCLDLSKAGPIPVLKSMSTRYRIARKTFHLPKTVAALTLTVLIGASFFFKDFVQDREKVALRKTRIAVLPFDSTESEKDGEFIAHGITDYVISSLARSGAIKVIAGASIVPYNTQTANPHQISSELNVGYLIEGSIRRSNQKYFVNVKLIDTATEETLWSTNVERSIHLAFTIQNEISSGVLAYLNLREPQSRQTGRVIASIGAPSRNENAGEVDNEAYKVLVKGKYFLATRNPADMLKGYEFIQQAVTIDPGYATAYAELAKTLELLCYYEVMSSSEAMPKAKKALDSALKLGSASSDTFVALAESQAYFERNWKEAEISFRKAIQVGPGNEMAHRWYAHFLVIMKRFDEAALEYKNAQELDPLSLSTQAGFGLNAYYRGDYAKAIKTYKDILDLDPKFVPALINLSLAQSANTQLPEALGTIRKAFAIAPQNSTVKAVLAVVLAKSGQTAQARKYFEELLDVRRTKTVSPYSLATVALTLGEKERAISFLQRSQSESIQQMAYLRIDPLFASVRSEPEIASLITAVGLQP